MAVARPLIVADLPALTEIAPDGVRSLAYPTGEPAGLAAAVARLMDDPGLAARIASAGREWVVAERTWAANQPRWDAVYRSVLDARAAVATRSSTCVGRRTTRGQKPSTSSRRCVPRLPSASNDPTHG